MLCQPLTRIVLMHLSKSMYVCCAQISTSLPCMGLLTALCCFGQAAWCTC